MGKIPMSSSSLYSGTRIVMKAKYRKAAAVAALFYEVVGQNWTEN